MNQQIYIHKYVQSQIIMLHEPVAITLVTTNSVAYNRNKISVQITAQECVIKTNHYYLMQDIPMCY